MKRIAIPSLVSAAIITGLGMVVPSSSRAKSVADTQGSHSYIRQEFATPRIEGGANSLSDKTLMAQLFYPPVSDRPGVMVQGQGKATAPADTARIEFLFSNQYSEEPEGKTPKAPKPLTQASLKPIVDALVAVGVPATAIEINTNPSNPPAFPFPISATEGAVQMVVRLEKPTRDRVQQIVKVAGDEKIFKGKFSLQNTNVEYAINDCPALERAAYAAAVNNARSRATALSEALGVKIADVPSIAESSFSLFNIFSASSSACGSAGSTPVFPFSAFKKPFNPATPAEVEVKKDIFVTYTIR